MDFEEANSQVDSLCGALPRDDLRMHKCIKSDISKVMYQMKCMDPLHASPTVNLSDPNVGCHPNPNCSTYLWYWMVL